MYKQKYFSMVPEGKKFIVKGEKFVRQSGFEIKSEGWETYYNAVKLSDKTLHYFTSVESVEYDEV